MTEDNRPETGGEAPPELRPDPPRKEIVILLVAALVVIAAFLYFVGRGEGPIPPSIPEQQNGEPAPPGGGGAQ